MSLSNQEIFNRVAYHLLTQKSRSVEYGGACVYRSSSGKSCAFGCLISDDEYTPDLEGSGVRVLRERGKKFRNVDLTSSMTFRLAWLLQDLHDYTAAHDWHYRLLVIAKDLGLSDKVVRDMHWSRPNPPTTNVHASPAELLVGALELIRTYGPVSQRGGICVSLAFYENVYEAHIVETTGCRRESDGAARAETLFLSLAKKWPKHSGLKCFPIPSGSKSLPHDTAYFEFSDDHGGEGSLWRGEQGALRRELIDFVFEEALREFGCAVSIRSEYTTAAKEKITEHPVSTIILNSYKDTPNE